MTVMVVMMKAVLLVMMMMGIASNFIFLQFLLDFHTPFHPLPYLYLMNTISLLLFFFFLSIISIPPLPYPLSNPFSPHPSISFTCSLPSRSNTTIISSFFQSTITHLLPPSFIFLVFVLHCPVPYSTLIHFISL